MAELDEDDLLPLDQRRGCGANHPCAFASSVWQQRWPVLLSRHTWLCTRCRQPSRKALHWPHRYPLRSLPGMLSPLRRILWGPLCLSTGSAA